MEEEEPPYHGIKSIMKIIIVNGPNLNLLGEREPEIYGYDSLEEVNNWIKNHDSCQDIDFEFFQSNSEGSIIDFLHQKRKVCF